MIASRSRHWWMVIVLVFVILALRAHSYGPLPSSPYFDAPDVLVIANRGGAGVRPENTLAAFRHAKRLGVDVLAMDVRLSADGELVLMHDDRVDRTSNGVGLLGEMSLNDIQNLDAAYHWLPVNDAESTDTKHPLLPPFRGEGITVPTFNEVLDEFPRLRLHINIRAEGVLAAEKVCQSIKVFSAQERILVFSSDQPTLKAFRSRCPSVATLMSKWEAFGFLLNQKFFLLRFYQPKIEALMVPLKVAGMDLFSRSLINDARSLGMHMLPQTINDEVLMKKFLSLGVSGIVTDHPDKLLLVQKELASGSIND